MDGAGAQHVHRRQALYLLVKLSVVSDELPPSLFVRDVDIGSVRDPLRMGGCADIYKGVYDGRPVAVKRLRALEGSKTKLHPVRVFSAFYERLAHFSVRPSRNSAKKRWSGKTCTTRTFYLSSVSTATVSRPLFAWFLPGWNMERSWTT